MYLKKNNYKYKNKFFSKKSAIALSSFFAFTLLIVVLNISLASFNNTSIANMANIKVAGMNFNITINGVSGSIITATGNNITKSNISIISMNSKDAKYELIYKVCSDASCTSFIEKPEDLSIEYSSRTIDKISGTISTSGNRSIRVIINNNLATTYYIKLDLNAGYAHNTLTLHNLISTEYNEDDITIAAIINGEASTIFPTTNYYSANIQCLTNKGPSNATGTVSWNGTKWVVSVMGADTSQTVCTVNFQETLPLQTEILAQGGGTTTIEAKGAPSFAVINGTSGLYAAEDSYGTSYYYRGLKTELNNNLIWGGFQWKIIRINGDGSIRLIYNGTQAQFNTNGTVSDTGSNTQIMTQSWNSYMGDAKYVGYMFGGTADSVSTTRAEAVLNQTSTKIKTDLENWYRNNILGKSFESQVVNNVFCNDRQLRSDLGGLSTGPGYGNTPLDTYYATYQRIEANKSPYLKCNLKNDRFTTAADTTIGNGALTYPIGLITASEAAFAGLKFGSANSTNYLYTNLQWWTMSPYRMRYSGQAQLYNVYSNGDFYYAGATYLYGVRPSISISSQTRVSGSGTASDPFVATAP